MSGDEAPPRSPSPERADAPEGDRGGSPDRGRDRSRSPPPRGRDSRSRSRSRDPPRTDDRGRSPGAYGGGSGGGRKMGIAGRWNPRGFGTYIDASLSHGGPSLPGDARIRRLIYRIGAPRFHTRFFERSSRARGRRETTSGARRRARATPVLARVVTRTERSSDPPSFPKTTLLRVSLTRQLPSSFTPRADPSLFSFVFARAGFITPEAGGEDVFCHFSAITDGNMLEEGARVAYDETFDERKGKGRAENVTGGVRGDDRGPPPRDDVCRDFQRGNCTRENCRFSHGGFGGGGGYGDRGGYGGDRGGYGGDRGGSRGICYDWQKGRCSRPVCRFSHEGPGGGGGGGGGGYGGGYDDRGPPPSRGGYGGGYDDRGPPPSRGGYDGYDDRGPPPSRYDDRGPPPRGDY